MAAMTAGGAAVAGVMPAAATTPKIARASIRLTASDPQYAYGFQVGDTLTLHVVVHDPRRAKPVGTVRFSTNNSYDRGCSVVRLRRSNDATCYVTYYVPGPVKITARYFGVDRASARVMLRIDVVPSTND